MAMLVITPEIEADAMRLAEATGQTPTEAMTHALQDKLRDVAIESHVPVKTIDIDAVMKLLRSFDGPVDYSLTEDEILGYDEHGIPEQPYLDRR